MRLLLVIPLLLLCGCDAIHATASRDTTAVIEAAVFEGGYGIHWHQKIAAEYSEQMAGEGLRVNLWGDPRVSEKVKPRILRGDPPDMILVHDLPVWRLIASDKLLPFDAALDEVPLGSDKPWRELFIPGTLDNFKSNGHVYAVPSAFGAYAIWYDARLFREHGWTPPATWDELLTLCEQAKAAGIAPFAYQGKYPVYAWWTLICLMQRCGGLEAINRINALDPEAFRNPNVVRAAGLLQQLATSHFQPGAMAMSHTESQLEFVTNKAAMIFCGLWLDNEMKESTPQGFEMRCFNVPAVSGGKGNPALFNGSGWEYIFVPRASRHGEEVMDFVRYMVSPTNAPDMGKSIGVISPLKGATPRENVSPALASAIDMIESAEGIFFIRHESMLLGWRFTVMEPAMRDLLRGEITPEEFCARLDAGIQQVLDDPTAIIPEAARFEPSVFGEAA